MRCLHDSACNSADDIPHEETRQFAAAAAAAMDLDKASTEQLEYSWVADFDEDTDISRTRDEKVRLLRFLEVAGVFVQLRGTRSPMTVPSVNQTLCLPKT